MEIVTRFQAINGREFSTAEAALSEDFRVLRDDLTRWLSLMTPGIMRQAKGWDELRKRFAALRKKYDEYEAFIRAEQEAGRVSLTTGQPVAPEIEPLPRDEWKERGTERHRMAVAPADTAAAVEEAQAA